MKKAAFLFFRVEVRNAACAVQYLVVVQTMLVRCPKNLDFTMFQKVSLSNLIFEPTEKANGYTGDEYCMVCNELVKRGTVIPATASSETTPPQTSDNSIFALCVFLLFVSGGAGILITVCGRKKNAV